MLAGLGRLLFDAVAPRRCPACDTVTREALCAACEERMAILPVPRPRRLGRGHAHAGFEFVEPVRSVLHRGKYGGDRDALEALAAMTMERLAPRRMAAAGAVVAVPLGARRRRRRGYNQAEVIAGVIAAAAGAALAAGLERCRETAPLTSSDEAARRGAMAGAFAWRGGDLGGACLWLVDDVLTTGATAEAAVAALRAGGAGAVEVLTVATVV